MSTEFDPLRLDVVAFARAGGRVSVNDSLSKYERLMTESIAKSGGLTVSWTAVGEWREPVGAAPQAWLHLEAQTAVPVTCQRCMTRMDAPLTASQWFRFVADEAAAEAEDDESEEDLLVTSRSFDLRALVEDELLLSLPMVPMHETCPVAVKLEVRDADFVDEDAPESNPFAVLSKLKQP